MPWWAHWKSSSYKLKLVAAFLFDTYFDTCFWCKKYLLQLYRKLWKMDRKRKLGFAAIFLSNRYFLNEISVEGKTTSKFYFKIAHYDQYAAQIIRTRNCITLLTTNSKARGSRSLVGICVSDMNGFEIHWETIKVLFNCRSQAD